MNGKTRFLRILGLVFALSACSDGNDTGNSDPAPASEYPATPEPAQSTQGETPASAPPIEKPPAEDPPAEDPPAEDPPSGDEISSDPFNAKLEVAPDSAPADGFPSVPQNLRIDLLSNDWVELNWAPSSDNGDVVEYRLYRDDGITYSIRSEQTHIEQGTQNEIDKFWQTTSFIDCNFTRFLNSIHNCSQNQPEVGGEYLYTVSAIDNEGNESVQSEPLRVKLYETSGSAVEFYEDIYLDKDDDFPFGTDFSSTANFIDRFELVFSEEFDGDQLDADKWNTILTWGHNESINGEQQYFVDILNDPDFGFNPFVLDGETLTIESIQTPPELLDAALGQPFLSGALSSHDKFGFTYGYTEGRLKVGGVPGQLTSFYLFRRWVAQHAPEIDIIEYLGENPFGEEDAFQTYHFRDTVHGITKSSPTMKAVSDAGRFSDSFHDYGVLWEPGLVVWYIDGQEVIRLTGAQIGRQQMNLVTYLVTGSAWAPTPDVSADIFPLKYEIDYIRVYQRDPYIQNSQ